MAMFDILAFGLILISVIISMMRGMIAEITSLLIWIVAFIVAKLYAVPFAEMAFSTVEPQAFGVAIAFIVLFIASWLVQHLLRSLLTSAVKAVGLGGINRLLGGIVGALKGIILVTLVVIVCLFTDLPQSEGWQQSFSAVYFEALARVAVPYLSSVLTDQIHYPTP
ncbi:CvpA family protein [Neisseria montereyensis]|uniref:CvpA family protein n=1 Tax=Neisseria montereyensis TaxID=2973938 RepID=A0ABT2FBQ7_9NEIS|nr:CvpA family protein [Neisseria montereyensis]MCS4532995.1 CvpA family protein [Neisseria montereyensis]